MHRSFAQLGQTLAALAGSICVPATLAVPPAFSNQTSSTGTTFTTANSGYTQSYYAGGGCVGDFNNDGWQDMFIMKGGGVNVPDRLYINNHDGTFTDQAVAWGLGVSHKGKGCAAGDFNNDGFLDIYVTSAGPVGSAAQPGKNKLYKNNGNGTFTDVAIAAGVNMTNPTTEDSWSAAWGDYDLDGNLDLFVGGFLTGNPSNIGNRLFHNNGNGTFTNVTASIGLFNGVGSVATQSMSFVDMDGDHYPELLLSGDFKNVNTFVGSRYFRNNGNGTFSDITVASGTGKDENGMGQTFGDFNNDGLLDWYVTSIYGFPPNNWTGNKLYRNLGNSSYTEYAASAGCNDGGYGWGAVAIDFNHDGLLDIAETNGDSSAGGQYFNEQSYLWMNNGNNTFAEMAITSGFIHLGKGRCMLHLDYDNDGDQDVVIVSNNEPLFLLRNDLPSGSSTNWLRVFLDTSGPHTGGPLAPNGYGARVIATIGGLKYMRSVDGENSFLGTGEISAHFGLSTATSVDELRIEWPNGTLTILHDIPTNRTITITPAMSCLADINGNHTVNADDLLMVINAWGPCVMPNPNRACPADISPPGGNGEINVDDLLTVINGWGVCP